MLVDTTFIYFLRDPENPNKGYVGKTDNPKTRLPKHFSQCRKKKFYRANWINSLRARGLSPALEIIAEVSTDTWKFWERSYIRAYRCLGFDLVNGTDGGEGMSNPTPEVRKKISDANSGEKNPHFGKTGVLSHNFGQKHTAAQNEQSSAFQTGKPLPPETCFNMRRKIKRVGDSSKFYGVQRHAGGKWKVVLYAFNKAFYLGYFSDEIEAARAYDAKAKKKLGKFAKLNFPD